jgi:mannose-6-phosphate isomerase-like protein (cupin superfamily)
MKAKVLPFFLFALALPILIAEETVPQGFEHWTSDSLKQLDQTLHTEADANANHMSVRRLGDFTNDTFMLSRRQADGIAEWHENQADVFFVQSGSATLLVGGTLVGAQQTEPHEKRNGTIQGGIRKKLSAGDVVRIPAQVPHQILLEGSKEFTYFVVKVKGY